VPLSFLSDIRIKIIAIVTLVSIAAVFFVSPVPQDPDYHNFADTRTYIGITNFLNVASNIPFLIVGVLGIFSLSNKKTDHLPDGAVTVYWLFFVSLILVCLGSGYYHLNPDNPSLVWDRLPMTIAFMAFFCAVIGEHFSYSLGKRLLAPFVVIGVVSVLYWAYTESRNAGDLRFYALVQFLPMLLVPIILILYRGRSQYAKCIWLLLVGYASSKLVEFWDKPIYELTGLVSGHTLKHLAASLSTIFFYLLVKKRLESRITV